MAVIKRGGTTLFRTIEKRKQFEFRAGSGPTLSLKKRLGPGGEIIGGVSHPPTPPLICAPEYDLKSEA